MAEEEHFGDSQAGDDEYSLLDQEVVDAYLGKLTEASLVDVRGFLCHPADKGMASASPVVLNESVSDSCVPVDLGDDVFTYAYQTWFENLGVRVPFSPFYTEVLKTLNVAPTQLHPNGWAHMRAFEIVCECLSEEASDHKFLYFSQSSVKTPMRWFSLCNNQCRSFMEPFRSSYKYEFKHHFFRLNGNAMNPLLLVDENGDEHFPLSWTRAPKEKFSISRKSFEG